MVVFAKIQSHAINMGVACLLLEVVNVKANLALSSDRNTFSARYHYFAYGRGGEGGWRCIGYNEQQ